MKTINVGLIGLGTVGSGVYEIIRDNAELIKKRTGVNIIIKAVSTRTKQKASSLGISDEIFIQNPLDLIKINDIDVVIELIGGYDTAYQIVSEAIKNKKHVITANKALIAKYGYELFSLAQKNDVNVLFEASVGGCIPILRSIEESFQSDNITQIYGILNGTTNYILTKMNEGMSYEDALKKAQELGFAEADPTFDVCGADVSQKLSILASLAFDSKLSQEPYTEGITAITKNDIIYAKELGYSIKLLAIAKKNKDIIELRTHPTMIPLSHVFANVNNENNAVMFSTINSGNVFLSGKGAGKFPTATVVVSDIIEVASRVRITERQFNVSKIMLFNETISRYYLRLNVVDKPGVFAKIAKILGDNNISIAAVTQKEENKEVVPIVVLTHPVREGDISNAINECVNLDVVKSKPMLIRIEDLK
jgi:homoserine dehydrogenase